MPTRSPESEPAQPRVGVRGFLTSSDGGRFVLRLFLGVTFTFAALQKLANPAFFRASASGSFAAQLNGAVLTSPLHHLLDFALHAPTLIASLIALGELAVGLGTLAGLFGRFAALGGMALSLSFFLTVSYNDSPYYYGADIVFLFAWTPFVLAGPGALSLDAWIHDHVARRAGAEPEGTDLGRRVVLGRLGAAGALGALGVVLGGLTDLIGRHEAPSVASGGTGTTTAGSSAPASTGGSGGSASARGQRIARASEVSVGGAFAFTDSSLGIPAYLVHPSADRFLAFSRICTHAGCTVGFSQSAGEFLCPCHGSIFNATTGAVIAGPAPSPLPEIALTEADGTIYLSD